MSSPNRFRCSGFGKGAVVAQSLSASSDSGLHLAATTGQPEPASISAYALQFLDAHQPGREDRLFPDVRCVAGRRLGGRWLRLDHSELAAGCKSSVGGLVLRGYCHRPGGWRGDGYFADPHRRQQQVDRSVLGRTRTNISRSSRSTACPSPADSPCRGRPWPRRCGRRRSPPGRPSGRRRRRAGRW